MADTFLFTNNAKTTLAAGIADTDLSLTVATGDGALFPSPAANQKFAATLIDASGNIEIAYCTSRTGDVFTITRGEEGTTAIAFASGDIVGLRITRDTLINIAQKDTTLQTNLNSEKLGGQLLAAFLLKAGNLSGLADLATSRSNLGLGGLSILSSVSSSQIDTDAVDQAEVAAGAIHQGELHTATASQTSVINSSIYIEIAPTGGTWTINYFLGDNDTTSSDQGLQFASNNTTYAAIVGIYNGSGSNGNAYLYSRYILASEPYDLGDGQTHAFPYVLIDNGTKKIEGFSFAVDPAWAYHASKVIRPDRWKLEGTRKNPIKVPYIDMPKLSRPNSELYADLRKGGVLRNKALDEIRNPVLVETKLTTALKNTYMNEVPHPFMNQDLTGKTVLLLDPTCKCVEDLRLIHDSVSYRDMAGNSVSDLIEKDYIRFGNTRLQRTSPNGVMIVEPTWRLT